MRAAIYARMSTDKQSADSPADQVARCREFAKARGWTVVESLVISEAGISGASRHNRPGLLQLVARIDEWDTTLCWDCSRLSRNQEDLGWLVNRLRSRRRQGFEVSSGMSLLDLGARFSDHSARRAIGARSRLKTPTLRPPFSRSSEIEPVASAIRLLQPVPEVLDAEKLRMILRHQIERARQRFQGRRASRIFGHCGAGRRDRSSTSPSASSSR